VAIWRGQLDSFDGSELPARLHPCSFGFGNGFGFGASSRSAPAAATPISLAFDSSFVGLGDSLIAQKSNAKSIDNPLAWEVFSSNGFFLPRPASDQGIGGNTTTQMLARVAYTASQKPDFVEMDGWINDIAASASVSTMQNNVLAIWAAIWAVNPNCVIGMRQVHACTGDSGPATSTKATLNAWLLAQQKLTYPNPVIVFTVPSGFDPATHTWDGTHFNALGGRLWQTSQLAQLAPYMGSGDLFASTGASGYYGANLDTNTSLAGTSGTVGGTGTSPTGSVATGKRVTNATTAAVACSKGTLNGATSQIITISGTATAGDVVFTGASAVTINGVQGDFFETFADIKITAGDGVSAPVGLKNMYAVLGSLGNHFATTVSGSDNLAAAVNGAFRTWAAGLRTTSTTVNPTLNFTLAAGTVDIRIEIGRPRLRKIELVAYAAPLYTGSDGIKASSETLRITGTATVGSTLTGEPGTWSGGALTHAPQWYRDGVAISGATAYTYVVQAADSGHTLTFGTNPSNSFGTANNRSAGVAIP
jgi:lysophospholipase L1-like esterase